MTRALLEERNILQRAYEAGTEEDFLTWFGDDHSAGALINNDLSAVVIGEFYIETVEELRLAIHSRDVGDRLTTALALWLNLKHHDVAIFNRSAEGDFESLEGLDYNSISDGRCS